MRAKPCFARNVNLRLALLLGVCSVARLSGMEGVTATELARGPSPQRVAALVEEGAHGGWGSAVEPLRATAFRAYETRPDVAPAWYHLYRWAELLATSENQATKSWIDAVQAAKAGHPNMARRYQANNTPLAAIWSRELQRDALGSAAFSEEFFSTLSPLDNLPEVLRILQLLYTPDPTRFAEYQNLALAIAVVYDVPPPPDWPHWQVDPDALPRQLPAPADAFAYWIKKDRANVSAHRLRRLPAAELKYLVDVVAPFSELEWAQRNIAPPLGDFAQAYNLVKYREDRVTLNQPIWPLSHYDLPTIFATGGICVDQAYFAATAGKARGIPTLLFHGAGRDGRHAWFGFLSPTGWVLDAGRYAEQKFVAGLACDPQTWTDISDHELLFLTERFRALPPYKLSLLHADFAAEYLHHGQPAAAVKAAREAVNRERRNFAAWEVLVQATAAGNGDARVQEDVLREAATAMQKYPELELRFRRRLIASLRDRGENSAAAAEEQHLAAKYRDNRSDLSYAEAAEMVNRSIAHDDLAGRIRVFNRVLDTYGRGAAIDFYDKVVTPFLRHLRDGHELAAARQALERARRTLRVEPGSQLDQEMNRMAEQFKKQG